MAEKIEDVLRELDVWYTELPQGTERPTLLSKLATLELCGWLEERFDALGFQLARAGGVDDVGTIAAQIDRTYGFQYDKHVRAVLLVIGGEVLMQRAELSMEKNHPGELERLRSALQSLWKHRNSLAHASSVAADGKQVTVNAPSWSIEQQRLLSAIIGMFEDELRTAIRIGNPGASTSDAGA